MIRVVNKRAHKWHPGEVDIYIGRPSPLGNPYPIKRSKFSTKIYTVEESLRLYREWLESDTISDDAVAALDSIRRFHEHGAVVNLVCWCAPGPCHGDIIRKFICGVEVPE